MRGAGFWIGVAALLIVLAVLIGQGSSDGPLLDPDATNATGTRALTELIEELGGSVDRGLPADDDAVALVLVDRDNDADRRAIESFARNGGTVVIADDDSWLSPPTVDVAVGERIVRGNCTLPELDDVGTLAGSFLVRFDAAAGDGFCFDSAGSAFVISETFGEGRLIHLGGAEVLTNGRLGDDDNAVLAARLLVPEVGARVAIVYDPVSAVGAEGDTLLGLIPTPVRWFGAQLTLAFGLLVWWRARRFGRVVDEPLPVDMPGSLLVQASAELRRRSRGHGVAITALRSDAERRLRSEYRLPRDTPIPDLIRTVVSRSDLTQADLEAALANPTTASGEGLVAVAAAIDRILPQRTSNPVPAPTRESSQP